MKSHLYHMIHQCY